MNTALAEIIDSVLASARDGVAPIVTAGDPTLRIPAQPFDFGLPPAVLDELIDVMRTTMYDAPGVGLAAPQIGIPMSLAVIEDTYPVDSYVAEVRGRTPQPFRVLIDPSYTPIDGTRSFYEGCLSVPGYQAVVTRHASVRLDHLDRSGRTVSERFDGWPARIVQHETDHLSGILYLDRADMRSFAANDTYERLWNDATPEKAAAALTFEL